MKLRLASRILGVAAALLCAFSVVAVRAQETCPYADDALIIYSSPSTLGKVGADMVGKYGFQDEIEAVNKLVEKGDAKIKEATNDEKFPKKEFDYLSKLVADATGESSVIRSFLAAYFKYVDGVVVAYEIPGDIDTLKAKPADGLSLSVIFNADPSALDPRKYLSDDLGLEIIKDGDGVLTGKFTIKDGEKKVAVVYFGGTKIKDVDKYVIVFGARGNVEKKIDRYQKSNLFITERLGKEGLVEERIVKENAFKTLVELARKEGKADDEKAKSVIAVIEQLKLARLSTVANADGVESTLKVETTGEDVAKNLTEVAGGGVALLKFAAAGKTEDLKPEEKLGLETLNTVKISQDGAVATASGKISTEQIRAFLKLAKEKCDNN